MLSIGIFLYDNVEILDFAGPFEVFSTCARLSLHANNSSPFTLFTFSNTTTQITTRGGLTVLPTFYPLETAPSPDILLIPGGEVAGLLNQPEIISYIRNSQAKLIASVCSGALLLASAGLLKGLRATTHWEDLEELKTYPHITVLGNIPFVDEGRIITSAGVASGISMSLHIVEKLTSTQCALLTAKQIDYPYPFYNS